MFWKLVYLFCKIPFIYEWLYDRIEVKPYHSIKTPDGNKTYMLRGWVLKRDEYWWQRWFGLNLCIRIHHIAQPDADRHMHSHPFNFRTIVLRGCYRELTYAWIMQHITGMRMEQNIVPDTSYRIRNCSVKSQIMAQGMTAYRKHGEFHRITEVDPKVGAVTLFIMWGGKRDDWGFMVDGEYVENQKYFAQRGIQQ